MASNKTHRCTKCGIGSALHLRLKPKAQAFARLDDKFICEPCYKSLSPVWDELWFSEVLFSTHNLKATRPVFATYPKALKAFQPKSEPYGGSYIQRGRKNRKSVYPNLPTYSKPEVKKSKPAKKSKAA